MKFKDIAHLFTGSFLVKRDINSDCQESMLDNCEVVSIKAVHNNDNDTYTEVIVK